MDIKLPSENPIEIINPGNGEPGIAPCYAVADTPEGGGNCTVKDVDPCAPVKKGTNPWF